MLLQVRGEKHQGGGGRGCGGGGCRVWIMAPEVEGIVWLTFPVAAEDLTRLTRASTLLERKRRRRKKKGRGYK